LRPENPIGTPFFELSEVDSTNNYAMRQVQAQLAVHGTVYFTEYQNAGKGQRGKPWNAQRGENIMMSIVLEPAFLLPDNQFVLNVAVALSCLDFFKNLTDNKASIKWPNDIYWRDKKAGGILIENVLKGQKLRYSIVGIGININQTFFPASLPNPVSLKQITGKTFDVVKLAKELCSCLNFRWQQITNNKEEQLLKEYCEQLYKRGEMVNFKKDDKIFSAIVIGVTAKGQPLLQEPGEEIVAVNSVKWLLDPEVS
jgi:BirA family transcriptional regulator, biotin operon repressor / biotin---[acetyl-CoA-carboxylase] ligase